MTTTPTTPPEQRALSHYEKTAVLRDGGLILVRAIAPSDKQLLKTHFARLGPDSVRHRFFGAKSELSTKDLKYFTEVDFADHVALGAFVRVDDKDKDELIGVGRYCRIPVQAAANGSMPAARAEVAFAVVDAHQGRGVGTILLKHLAAIAHAEGIEELDADVMADNAQMMHVFTNSGFDVRESLDDGIYHVCFPTNAMATFLHVRHDLAARSARPPPPPPSRERAGMGDG